MGMFIGEYQVVEELISDGKTGIYSAHSSLSGEFYIIRVCDCSKDKKRTLNEFSINRDFNIASGLDHPNIARPVDKFICEYGLAIVYKHIEGTTLERALYTGKRYSLSDCFKIVSQILDALHYIHSRGILHCNINPQTVFIGDDNGVKLFDFRYALTDDEACKIPEGKVVGKIPYISPEQTGFTENKIDARSDLFCTGVLFYKLLCGKVPFGVEDGPMDQFLTSMFKTDVSPIRSIHVYVNEVLLKALRIMPSERYQTASGFKFDIQSVTEILIDGNNSSFIAGKKDLLIAAGESKVFIARDEEIQTLKKSYDNFLKKGVVSVVIYGPSGIGKTEIVKQFRKGLRREEGIQFINVKCNQFTIHQPFSVYNQIILSVISSIDTVFDIENRNSIINYLNRKMQGNSGLICKIIPEMSEWFPKINNIDKIEPDKEADRLTYVLSNLLKTFCEKLKLILFVDDIQWIDKVSNDILLNCRNISCPMMLISTLRTDGEYSRKMLFGNQIAKTADKIVEIKPLHETDIEWYLSYKFGDISNKYYLRKLILQKCNGNPFMLLELIKYLIDSSLLYENENGWEFRVREVCNLPDHFDSVSLIMHRFSGFDKEQMSFLQICAIIGKADMSLINELGAFGNKLVPMIRKMEYAGIIRYTGNGECVFLHDKIHAAVLRTINENNRIMLYEKLANVYESRVEQDKDYLFKAANAWLNTGNVKKAFHYSYNAGQYAREKLAFDHSVRFFRNALLLAGQLKKTGGSELTVSVYKIRLSLGDALLLSGKHEQAMHVFSDLLENDDGRDKKLTIDLLSKLGIIFYKMGEFKQSIVYLKRALAYFEIRIPEKRILILFNLLLEVLRQALHSIGIKRRVRKQKKGETVILRLLNKLSLSLYFTDMFGCLYYHVKALNLFDKLEYSCESIEAYLTHGIVVNQLFMKKRGLKYVKKAISQAKKLNRTDLLATGYSYQGMVLYFGARWKEAEESFNTSIELFESIGDMSSKSLCTEHLWRIQLMRGQLSEAKKYIQYTIVNCRKTEDKHYLHSSTSAKVMINTIQKKGSSPQDIELVNKSFKNRDIFLTYTHTAMSLFEKEILEGNYVLAEEIANVLIPFINKNGLNYEYNVKAFSLMCELIFRKYSGAGFGAEKGLRFRYMRSLMALILSSFCYPAYRGAAYRAIAWYLILAKREKLVSKFFKKSIGIYHRLDINYEKARTVNDYGNFLEKKNAPGLARNQFDIAYKLFESIGACLETDRLVNRVSNDVRREIVSSNEKSSVLPMENSNHVRFDSLLMVSSSISGISEMPVLLNQILTAMIKVTGAQYGGIFLCDNNNETRKMLLRDYAGNNLDNTTVYISSKLLEKTRQYKQVICVRDGMEEEFKDGGIEKNRSVLCAPLFREDNYMGCVYLGNDKMSGLFSESAIKSAQILAAQASILMENAFLVEKYKQLNRDLDKKVKQQTQDILEKNHQLEIANLKLVESERMKGILSGTLVHDIKNYAAGIEGNLQYLGRRLENDPKIKRIVDMVCETCSDIVSLASNLLDVAKMDDGKLLIRAENLQFGYIEGMILKFTGNSLFEEKNITLKINSPVEPFVIKADVYLLERVIQNMISNAAKYIPKNGSFELSFESLNNYNTICFFNSGRPIPDNEKDILFEKYARLENRQSQYSKGLGLFFCRMVMNAHNGKIWVDSDEFGNCFKLAFPRIEEKYPQIQTPFEVLQA
ncbi:MAG: AAA family ATPase [Fibrobacter sp.]|nr:AAA family ATPase [Fibrobacter sp.]